MGLYDHETTDQRADTLDALHRLRDQHRTLRLDWHRRAVGNPDYQAGYAQAKHDTLNLIMQAIRDEARAMKECDGAE